MTNQHFLMDFLKPFGTGIFEQKLAKVAKKQRVFV